MKKHEINYLDAFTKTFPDFLKTIDKDQATKMLQAALHAIKKTKKKEKDFHMKVRDILQKELGRREEAG